MNKLVTSLEGVFVLEPKVFGDARGFFLESYNEREMAGLGMHARFVQDNHSYSTRNVVRGLHYQIRHAQGKLVRAVMGEILDVVVDLRKSSRTFGQWSAVPLSADNKCMLWIPPGFAHGFRVVSDGAHVLYKATHYYEPASERTLAWNDPELKINWQLSGDPIVSGKDQRGVPFRDAEKFD
ncbi:MAG: dTDP-4-dehydrorhamnose 3,5-epimerase [Terriglobales bacterium]